MRPTKDRSSESTGSEVEHSLGDKHMEARTRIYTDTGSGMPPEELEAELLTTGEMEGNE